MKNKIILVLVSFLIFSCNSTKPVITTKKSGKTVNNSTSKKTKSSKNEVVLQATSKVKVTNEMINKYISDFSTIAKDNMKKHRIPASITLAQGILESGSGTGRLCINANNHFGIKCHTEWTGESVRYDDDAAQECFRKYNHPKESYNDHSLFLTSRPRYADLFKLDIADYQSWANGLKAAGYATDKGYPEKLISIIERYELYKYDEEVLGSNYKPKKIKTPKNQKEVIHIVVEGDTLYSISNKYNITIDQLKENNNMTDNIISLGQELKIK